jgi:hypothetical protein
MRCSKTRGYYRLWAYVYVNWYCPEQWEQWTRGANPAETPVLKIDQVSELLLTGLPYRVMLIRLSSNIPKSKSPFIYLIILYPIEDR